MTTADPIVAKPGQSLGGLVLEAAAGLGERTIRGVLAEVGTSLLDLVHHSIGLDELAQVANCLDLKAGELIARSHPILADDGRRRDFFGVSIGSRPGGISSNRLTSISPYCASVSVRGIGVAVMTRRCGGRSAFACSIIRCATPKRCCSSTTTSPRSR